MLKIFIVEDDSITSKVLTEALRKEKNFEVLPLFSGKELIEHLTEEPDVISLDYYLPDYTGTELFKKIKNYNPSIPIIIVSGQQDIATAIDLLHKEELMIT
jgi:DNA-binding NtrC family response regulator